MILPQIKPERLVTLLILLLTFQSLAFASEHPICTAYLIKIQGRVWLKTNESDRYLEVTRDVRVADGDLVILGDDTYAYIQYFDRTATVPLEPGVRYIVGAHERAQSDNVFQRIIEWLSTQRLTRTGGKGGGAAPERLIQLPDNTTLDTARPYLAWLGINDSASYQISLSQVDSSGCEPDTLLWTETVADTFLAYPERQAQLKAGKRYRFDLSTPDSGIVDSVCVSIATTAQLTLVDSTLGRLGNKYKSRRPEMVSNNLEAASFLLETGFYVSAVEMLLQAIADNPEASEPVLMLASVYAGFGFPELANHILKKYKPLNVRQTHK